MIKKITGALSLTLMASTAMAGGLERSNQSVSAIFETGNYVEMSFGSVRPNVTGTESAIAGGDASGDMAGDYTQVGFALKFDINDNISVSIINDTPYGGNVDYPTGTGYSLAGTNATVDSNALTAIVRYAMNENFSAYAGVRRQSVEGDVAITGGYTMNLAKATGTGYLAGVAYEIPEIALRASLTYNSEIDSTHAITETGVPNYSMGVTTPKSWHLEAQSGIAEDTLLFGSIRWVNWGDFALTPTAFAAANSGDSLLSYDNDVTTYTLGVGRRLNENWSMSLSAQHEKSTGGGGNFGPNDGSTGVTLGARYSQDNFSISGGINYTWLGDASFEVTDTPVSVTGTFTDNYAVGAGIRIGYHF